MTNLKRFLWFGAIGLLAPPPSLGQSLEELQRQLAEKNAEIQRLRQRVEMLEREVTPRRIEQAHTPPEPTAGEPDDVNRALERALVRERGLLLSPGAFEIEPNVVYTHSTDKAIAFRRDSFGPALVLRAGLPQRWQAEVALPYVYERRRSGATSTNSDGIGDVTFSLSRQLVYEQPLVPSIIGTLSYQKATGRNTLFESATPVARGSGFDSIQGAVALVKRVDPLVFFGSYGFTHTDAERKGGVEVDVGSSHALRFGAALATSPATSLRAAFNLTFFEKTRIDGVALEGTDEPVGVLELGGSVALTGSTALDVLVGAGVTHSAPDYRIVVALPMRF